MNQFNETVAMKWPFSSKRDRYMNMPLVKPLSPAVGLALFSGIALVGVSIGAAIGTYVFFGTATLVGMIVVIENNSMLKRIAIKSNRFIDGIILIASIYAMASLGVTVAASLTFCGLGYTLIYAPHLRSSHRMNHETT